MPKFKKNATRPKTPPASPGLKSGDDLSKYTLSEDEPDASQPDTSSKFQNLEETDKTGFFKGIKGLIWAIFLVLIFGSAAAASVFIYSNKTSQLKNKPEPLPTITPSTPTPAFKEPEVIKSDFEITVLNGSGISGEAALLQELLEQTGFTVASIGNADRHDYQDTVIQVKKDTPEILVDDLKTVLEKTYSLGELEELSDRQNSDIVLIIGKNKI